MYVDKCGWVPLFITVQGAESARRAVWGGLGRAVGETVKIANLHFRRNINRSMVVRSDTSTWFNRGRDRPDDREICRYGGEKYSLRFVIGLDDGLIRSLWPLFCLIANLWDVV